MDLKLILLFIALAIFTLFILVFIRSSAFFVAKAKSSEILRIF
jgi:hypothetical protein